jgi:hypothetical protein
MLGLFLALPLALFSSSAGMTDMKSTLRRILWCIQDNRHMVIPAIGFLTIAAFWVFAGWVIYYGATRNG